MVGGRGGVAALIRTHLIIQLHYQDNTFMGDRQYRGCTVCDLANCRVLCTDPA